jgi:ATP-dependent Lhr-like helicase
MSEHTVASVFPRLHPRLQTAIVHRLGWQSLRPVQDEAGHALLDGHNAVVLAPTAGGKTEASVFPTLSILLNESPTGVGALYIAPIKALLNNQEGRLGQYTEMVGLRRFVWHGDVPTHARNAFLALPAELLMTTPESLEVMLVSTKVDVDRLFADLRVVIVDEVHALAGTDRGAHLLSVIERLATRSRHDVQRVGLSATVGNPEAIAEWLKGSSKRASVVVNPPAPPARRQLLVMHRDDLGQLAADAAQLARGQKSLFFCEARRTSEAMARGLERFGTQVFVHHSSMSAEERQAAEAMFHEGKDVCITCTSTLELGIDVGDLDRVLQHEAPGTVSSFMQRMGRTGRRTGSVANTVFFCENDEAVWVSLALIRLARRRWVERVAVTDRCWPIVVHQLLAMALASRGVTPEAAWAHFQRLPDVAGIRRVEFDRLVAWMCRETSLELISGHLVLGRQSERQFGKRNFLDLYAVFSSPASYKVETLNGAPVGSVDQDFVDRLVEGVSVFRLGGRGWSVVGVEHKSRVVRVMPGAGGVTPTWSGIGGRVLSEPVCAEVRALLSEAEVPSVAHATAAERLAEARAEFAPIFAASDMEDADNGLTWWTFAGLRINATLVRAFKAVQPDWKVVASNFSLRFEGDVGEAAYNAALVQIAEPEFWENERLWLDIAEGLPNYRLSKFQRLMPPWVQREMVATFLLDIEGAARWLIDHGVSSPDWGSMAPADAPVGLSETACLVPQNPVVWVETHAGLVEACAVLAQSPRIGLDVETTLRDQSLCLVQLANADRTWIVDPFLIEDLRPLAALMMNPAVVKLIHNASFERRVLGQHGIEIEPVVDTLVESRARRKGQGKHGLSAVCARELGARLDKRPQTSDWRRRPLTAAQLAYAALDAEVLLRVADALGVTSR